MPLFRKSNGKSTLFRSINADLRNVASQGDAAETLELIKKGAKFIPNKEGRTALHLAVMNAHMHVVQILIEHGCDLNHKDKLGYTPLHRACFEGYEDIVRLLLDANAKVDEQDFVQENTALHEAAWRGHGTCVELLLKAKANVYVRNKIGATALHLACQNGYNLSCRLLLQHGCKPNVKDKYDDTPLHTSCRYLHVGVARILLAESNINTNEQNKNGDTPLHLSCNLGQKKLSKMLIEHEARLDIKNKQGETPLDIASRKQQSELVQILKHGSTAVAPKHNVEKKLKTSKIRERLKITQGPDSSWQLLFQDWTPSTPAAQLDILNGNSVKQCTATNNLTSYPPDVANLSNNNNVQNQSMTQSDREQHFIDSNGVVHKGPISCYCVPLFYRLAKHNDEAHRELLEEIDACQTNLNGEICDLRQITERKFIDFGRSVKTKLERERHVCSQKMIRYFDEKRSKRQEPLTDLRSSRSKSKLHRSKSESEMETDVERERTTAAHVDSDSLSNASGDVYLERYLSSRNAAGAVGGTLNRKPKPTSKGAVSESFQRRIGGVADQSRATTFSNSFDETVRQFNKIDMENLNESSCTTPTTASSGNAARISLYSCQSNQSSSQQSSLLGKIFQPPSVDSGYGTKVENSPVHLTFPSFPLPPPVSAVESQLGYCSERSAQRLSFDSRHEATSFVAATSSPVASAFRPVLPTKFKQLTVETQTESTNTSMSDLHEYTELECMLRSATTFNVTKENFRALKPPPVLPIPPPPRKPLPPLPSNGPVPVKMSKRRQAATTVVHNNGCLSTNV